jgi:hypothetical protein
LRAESGSQEAALGTYCWQAEEKGMCIDSAGLSVPSSALTVAQEEQLTFSVPGIDTLVNVEVDVYAYEHTEIREGQRMILYPAPDTIEIPYQNDGSTVTMTTDLPPGQYVISVSAGIPESTFRPVAPDPTATTVRGDATYGFHVNVVEDKP